MKGRSKSSHSGSVGGYVALCAAVLVVCLAFMLLVASPLAGHGQTDSAAQPEVTADAAGGEPDAEQLEAVDALLDAQHARQDIGEEDVPAAFAAEREANSDVCAWLCVPGTNVSLPIARRAGDNEHYTVHNSLGQVSGFGSCFMDGANSPGFGDPVTVLYGHSFSDDDLMLTQLHRFEDREFFEAHDEFRIYLPDRVLTYRIVSARRCSSDRITDMVDFSDRNSVQSYLDFAVSLKTSDGFQRETGDLDAGSDRIVQLSTCTLPEANESARFLVTGVLVGEQYVAA